MLVNASCFKAYDIRGIVGAGIDEAFAEHLGRAFGSEAVKAGASNIACRVTAMSPSLALKARLIWSTSCGGGWSATK